MPLSLVKVYAEVREKKISFVCASCSLYWQARERSAPDGECMAAVNQQSCGGPLSGSEFPLYDGPFKGHFASFCLACGQEARYVFRATNTTTLFGLCSTHNPKWMLGLCQESVQLVAASDGTVSLVTTGPRKKNLFEAIEEVETYYAKKEGRL